MKKTLLATAIVGALGASAAAQAATVYDQDGTKLDIYGRIALGIEGGGPEFNGNGDKIDNGEEFSNIGSRIGLRMSHEVTRDLTAFGRAEFRFDADERNSDGFKDVRHTYLGLKSDQYGTFQAGNFDSFYLQFVSDPFDAYIEEGLEFVGGGKQSEGDSIGYYTPDLNGFTVFLQAKHYSARNDLDASGTSSDVAAQGGVRYAQGPLTIGLGFVDDVRHEDAGNTFDGGNDEMLYGLVGSYDITDQFSARLGYEGRENNSDENIGGGYDTVGVGGTFTTGPWAFNLDYYNIERDDDDNSNAWAAGAYYNVSSNFDVFAELYDGDAPSVDSGTTFGDLTDDVYWVTGARYHF